MNEETSTAFSGQQYLESYPDGIENDWWSRARSAVVARWLRRMGAGKVLEVGAGRGVVVKNLHGRGMDIFGVELAAAPPLPGVEQMLESGVNALEMEPEFRQRFDTLMLLDVIEHVPDAESFVRDLAAAYPNVRRILVTVPARRELWSNHDEYYGHYRRYELGEMEGFAAAVGANLTRSQYFFHLLYVPVWIAARLGGRNTEFKAPESFASRLFHRFMSVFFLVDYLLLPGSVPGTSIIFSLDLERS